MGRFIPSFVRALLLITSMAGPATGVVYVKACKDCSSWCYGETCTCTCASVSIDVCGSCGVSRGCSNLDSSCLGSGRLKHGGWCDMRQIQVPAGIVVKTSDSWSCSGTSETINGPRGRELGADRCAITIDLQSGWTCGACQSGKYRLDGGTGEPTRCGSCSTGSCAAGEYRRPCGTSRDSECVSCTSAACGAGKYRESCPAGSTADASCVSCSSAACPVGRYRETCQYASTTDAECIPCTNAPERSFLNPAEAARTYSSIRSGSTIGTGYAQSMLGSSRAWSAAGTASGGEWLVMDLQGPFTLSGVVIEARSDADEFVTEVEILYAPDTNLNYTSLGRFFPEATYANQETDSVIFPAPVVARYVKIVVWAWQGRISMRAGVLEACNGYRYSTRGSPSRSNNCVWEAPPGCAGQQSANEIYMCPPGTYSATWGLTSCTRCQAGKFQDVNGSTICNLCPEGTYQNHTGQSYCFDCTSGKYSVDLGRAEGKYTWGVGAVNCSDIETSSSTSPAPTTPSPTTTTPSPTASIVICPDDTKPFTINGISLCVPPKLYPASNVSHCVFDKTWEDIQANRYIFQTGGLGNKMRGPEWKVWVCGAQLPCAIEKQDWACFTYNELHDVFVPWGYNLELLIVRKC